MPDTKKQMQDIRRAYVIAESQKEGDRLTRADIERVQNFMKNKDKLFGIERDEGDDLPMSKESSPTVTDTETGKTTFGKPQNFSCGGMGKAVRGGKFIGVK